MKLDDTIIKWTTSGFLFCKINATVFYINQIINFKYKVFNPYTIEQCKEA